MTAVAAREYADAFLACAFSPAVCRRDARALTPELLSRLQSDEAVDLFEVLRLVVDDVVERLEADRGTLYLVDQAKQEMVSCVAHLPELAEIRLKVGEGLAGWVAEARRAINVAEGSRDARFSPQIDLRTGYQTHSLLAVPVLQESVCVGVLQVLNKRHGSFSTDDEQRLCALAREVARVLDATSLRSQLRAGNPRALAFRFNHIVGESPAMQEVFRRVAMAARTDATVLVRGESGTGKELIARAVHVNSARRDKPLVVVDCAALPEALIENELFGHERGAFTSADRAAEGKVLAADGGTLFLDEVGELPVSVQGKLLRLLQERTFVRVGSARPTQVDVRFVCATHRNLEDDVASGRFRKDLYFRLRVVQIELPALRLRGPDELDRLVDHLFFEAKRRHHRPELSLTLAARAALHGHDWPGNVRELENCIESAVVLAPRPHVEARDLPLFATAKPLSDGDFATPITSLENVERAYIEHVVGRCGGNRSEAARVLGIGRNTLLRKLRES